MNSAEMEAGSDTVQSHKHGIPLFSISLPHRGISLRPPFFRCNASSHWAAERRRFLISFLLMVSRHDVKKLPAVMANDRDRLGDESAIASAGDFGFVAAARALK